jgi:hypothetical protein
MKEIKRNDGKPHHLNKLDKGTLKRHFSRELGAGKGDRIPFDSESNKNYKDNYDKIDWNKK